ncbi:MAG: hypothetical protein LBF34_04590 [Puniceicoccales bacterium]|jgi:hypothetical protein|nr:hypothetical protein [Puniceicoccales bacterium]
MKKITKTIMVGLLFSLSGMVNCMAIARWFSPREWFDWLANDTLYPYHLDENLKESFWHFEESCERREIDELDFAKAVIHVFRDRATKKAGLMNILCEQCKILDDDKIRIELMLHCLCNPFSRKAPVLMSDIPDADMVRASNDPCTNPDPVLCRAVMAADSLEKVTGIFNDFGQGSEADLKVAPEQLSLYAKAAVFKRDISSSVLILMIEKKKFSITGEIFRDFEGGAKDTQEVFQVLLNYLQKPEADGGVGLNGADAFHVFKQIVLAYRGQNGTADGAFLIGHPLCNVSNGNLIPVFNGVAISMKFENLDGRFVLVEKTECSPILGIRSLANDGALVTSQVRFRFPGNSEIRTQLPITSTRIPSADETIEWSCPFREAPPRKIIFYGGCNSAASTQ